MDYPIERLVKRRTIVDVGHLETMVRCVEENPVPGVLASGTESPLLKIEGSSPEGCQHPVSHGECTQYLIFMTIHILEIDGQ